LRSHTDWNSLIVGKIAPFIDVDHEDDLIRKQNEKMLDQELSFAGHLSLPAIMMPLREKNVNLARIIHNRVMVSPLNQVESSTKPLQYMFIISAL
jgi:type II protein arginine methyltransferase